jgi:UDP-glucose 4-epimerase
MPRPSKVIVTGGGGFIGSHIVDALIARGVETIVLDNFTSGSMENLAAHKDDKLLRIVVGEAAKIKELLQDVDGVDVVFHEAAIASVPKSVSHPMLVHDVNVNASLEVMNFCVSKHIKRLVFASSAAVYGVLKSSPANEEMVCRPSSPYGASKLAVEDYLSAYYRTYGLETVGLRYFNVYGPRQKMSDYSGVITVFANTLLQGKSPTLYGDGLQTRDFVYVKDIAHANLLAMESEAAAGEIFNVGSGRSTTLLQLIETLKNIIGVKGLEPKFEPPRVGDVRSGEASIAKITKVLGYRPAVALDAGLAELVDQIKGAAAAAAAPGRSA